VPPGTTQWDRGRSRSAPLVDICSVSPTLCVGGSVNQTNEIMVVHY
jgi:hypothetical protein